MSKQNRLATVIPAYKSTFLPAALDSIAAQTCQDFTLYIGDDCSPNNIGEIVERYRDKINLVYKRFDTNLGGKDLVAQWERCIDMTQEEEWLWLFSDDDVMEENCVELFYDCLKKTKGNYDLYHFDVKIIDDSNKICKEPQRYPQDIDNFSFYKGKLRSKYASLVVENVFSREIYLQKSGFKNFDLAWGSDTATWVLFSERKGFHTINGAFVKWRRSNQNISPDLTSPIVERKVNALLDFLSWGKEYFNRRGKKCLYTHLRAFINRMTEFHCYMSDKSFKGAVNRFCEMHGCKAMYLLLYLLIKYRERK